MISSDTHPLSVMESHSENLRDVISFKDPNVGVIGFPQQCS